MRGCIYSQYRFNLLSSLYFRFYFILTYLFVNSKGVYKNLIKVGEIFLEKFPKEIQLDNIKSEILKIKHIEDVHGVRGWSIDSNQVSLSLHISVLGNTTVFEVDELREQIELILKEQSVHYSSIEFESTTHQCIDKNQQTCSVNQNNIPYFCKSEKAFI